MTDRKTRYQGAIIKNDRILLVRHQEHEGGRSYWVFPGGGIEPGETERECVQREMNEETNLDVRIISLLLDAPPHSTERTPYCRIKTYLCEVIGGKAELGYEPEGETRASYNLVEIKWFNLRDESSLDSALANDPIIYVPLQSVRKKLGYIP